MRGCFSNFTNASFLFFLFLGMATISEMATPKSRMEIEWLTLKSKVVPRTHYCSRATVDGSFLWIGFQCHGFDLVELWMDSIGI